MKVGPLSTDLVVGLAIYDHQQDGTYGVEMQQLVEALQPTISETTILRSLDTLEEWGVVKEVFTQLRSGRAGRLFSVSGESHGMIKETYEEFWERIAEIINNDRESGGDPR